MPTTLLQSSPLVPGRSPVEIFYRDEGKNADALSLVLLHGGWGYSLNPFDRQIERLRHDFRVISPDRSGYGGSTRLGELDDLPADFHYRAAIETLAVLASAWLLKRGRSPRVSKGSLVLRIELGEMPGPSLTVGLLLG